MEIKFKKKYESLIISQIQNETRLYLYGKSELSKEIIHDLYEYKVVIKGVIVSDQYYEGGGTFEGLKIFKLKDIIDNGEKISVIIGFDPIRNREYILSLAHESYISSVYIYHGCGVALEGLLSFFENDKITVIDNYYRAVLERKLDHSFYEEKFDQFEGTYGWLSDELSCKTMKCYLNGHVNLEPFATRNVWTKELFSSQYFPDDIVALSDDEVFVDCGAYTGDTFESFSSRVGSFKKYYALEPDVRRAKKLSSIADDRVVVIPEGAWSKKERLYFSDENECGMITGKPSDIYIDCDSIDNIVDSDVKVTFIKMDIEGAELEALKGAVDTIKRCHPKLAICVYHKREDLITIPQFIKSIDKSYKLYLRAHYPYVSETVLYAI